MNENDQDTGPLIPAKQACARYKIVTRTLGRWLENEALKFPRPIVINGRRYFRERLLEEWEKRRAGSLGGA
ncbi:DNA-binding protein [Bradyrhizobium sp.]|uniref:DNA-binding protein n=1 Tax=Bradyrhizobium sp. TaxID=376 RepID=UPI0027377642|nr:DNA-binding protein [Bradyrhizobium sp.]MDP3691843.1 DNA-binding protein [Bradyrhizobium sp.]